MRSVTPGKSESRTSSEASKHCSPKCISDSTQLLEATGVIRLRNRKASAAQQRMFICNLTSNLTGCLVLLSVHPVNYACLEPGLPRSFIITKCIQCVSSPPARGGSDWGEATGLVVYV